ncbi:MAG TPA: response regulator transcription factor [Pyrinomonadaceae bacterium]|jgi:two-component system NarL family response regulator
MMEQTNAVGQIRILIADDHPFFLDGLTANLEAEPDMSVVARAADGRRAVELCREHAPDVVLIDLRMPVMNGVEAIREIVACSPASRIIVLTTYDGDEDIHRALKAGAKSYLLKDVFREELLAAIREVYRGRRHIPAQVAGRLAERSFADELTEREREVLRHIAGGKTNREIGAALDIAEGTVKAHVNNILNKLNANDRTQAAMIALERGLFRFD